MTDEMVGATGLCRGHRHDDDALRSPASIPIQTFISTSTSRSPRARLWNFCGLKLQCLSCVAMQRTSIDFPAILALTSLVT